MAKKTKRKRKKRAAAPAKLPQRTRLVSRRGKLLNGGAKTRPDGKQARKPFWKKLIPLTVMGIGLVLVIIAVVLEANHYPWGLLFGRAAKSAAAIADPSPIVLDEEDQAAGIIITSEQPSWSPAAAAASPNAAPSASAAAPASSDAAASLSPSAAASPQQTGAILPGDENASKAAPPVVKYVVIGTLKIPVLGVSQNILEGSGKQMKYGVGHVTGSAQPGAPGNCDIAGHRPFPFRYLDKLAAGDAIILKSGGNTYTYTVFDSLAVLPEEVWVLNNMAGEDYTLTLITCTPYMVSSHRLIIRARLTDVNGMSPQAFYGTAATGTPPPDTSAAPSDAAPTATAPAAPSDTSAPVSSDISSAASPSATPETPTDAGSASSPSPSGNG